MGSGSYIGWMTGLFADSAEYLSAMTKSYPCGLLDMVFVDIASNLGAVLGVDPLGDSFLTAV